MVKFLKLFAKIFLLLSLIFVLLISLVFILIDDDFDIDKINYSAVNFEFYDDDLRLITNKSSKNNNDYVKISTLNKHTLNAFIAIEDRKFYTHNGIDYKRIVGATINNLKSFSYKEGASTITQQLVKNTYLSSEKSVYRKLKEIKIAKKLEKTHTKDEILEAYLNTIYFGKGAYGLQSASRTYFNKNASELSVNESALLAGVIKAPTTYSPINNYEKALNRKNVVLKSMLDSGFISNKEYQTLKNQEITLSKGSNKNFYDDYLDGALSQFENSNLFSPYINKTIKINTFLNVELQREISKYNVENHSCSKIVINSKNNGVAAYYGENSNLKRSPASCVKPWLVYAPMFEENFIKQSSVLSDEEVDFNGYKPKNYNDKYYGKVTVKDALIKSLNVPAVKLLSDFTIKKANKYTKKMCVDLTNESLTSALGAIQNGLTLKELSEKYSVFNDNGNFSTSSFIKSIYINNVKVYEFLPLKSEVFSDDTVFLINDILKENTKIGTSKKLKDFTFDLCAKTGTNGNNNGNIDAYSISYTTDNIIGVWVGNLDNSLMENSITGSNHPTIITGKILSFLYKDHKPSDFIVPTNVSKVKIDKNLLFEDNIEVISDTGETFYYKNKTAPTKILKEESAAKLLSHSISLKNGLVEIKMQSKNAQKIEIIREFNGSKNVIYSGSVITKFCDNIYDFGEYNYKIILYNNDKSTEVKLNSIYFTKENLDILKDDNWLLD